MSDFRSFRGIPSDLPSEISQLESKLFHSIQDARFQIALEAVEPDTRKVFSEAYTEPQKTPKLYFGSLGYTTGLWSRIPKLAICPIVVDYVLGGSDAQAGALQSSIQMRFIIDYSQHSKWEKKQSNTVQDEAIFQMSAFVTSFTMSNSFHVPNEIRSRQQKYL